MNKEYNYGIELFRIISILMIVLLHVTQCGGITVIAPELGVNFKHYIIIFLETIGVCGVDCFGVISGYVGYGHKTKYSRIISLNFQVLFYTTIGLLFAFFFNQEMITASAVGQAIFPFALGTYWYYSAYFVLFFFMPYINSALSNASKRHLTEITIVIFVVLSVMPTLFHFDFAGMKEGFGAPWLVIMYIIGAIYKKYEKDIRISSNVALIIGIALILFTWIWYMIMHTFTLWLFGKSHFEMLFMKYTSPTIALTALMLLVFFSKVKVTHGKIAKTFGKATFGVLLFHDNPIIGDLTIRNRFMGLIDRDVIVLVLSIFAVVIVIFFVSSFIDLFRNRLFKLIQIDKLSVYICRKFRDYILRFKIKLKCEEN